VTADKNVFEVETEIVDGRPGRARGSSLVVTWNGGSLVRELPARGALTLGRGADADVVIEHTSVSRKHARLVVDGDAITVEDLGSSNGTWVEGARLPREGSRPIRPGSLVEIGSVLVVVRSAGDDARAASGARASGPSPASASPGGPVVVDPAMVRVHELVDLVARSKLSVILLGETGAGKEVLATRVHRMSPRADKAFVKVNCAALVESLLEAELFGYERGAFTGADRAKAGLLEEASGGTLFLDELGEMPLTTQAKLLRVLESGEVMRVGGLKPHPVDVRFVAATNRDLKERVGAGAFRQDLFFRLDGMSIRIPPLRERPSEIAPLARAFVARACAEAGRAPLPLSDEAVARLLTHAWPGNVRELKNVMDRSVVLCAGDVIRPDELRFEALGGAEPEPASGAAPGSLPSSGRQSAEAIAESQRTRILQALEACNGNQTQAAKLLGISRRTLLHRLDALKLARPRKRDDEP